MNTLDASDQLAAHMHATHPSGCLAILLALKSMLYAYHDSMQTLGASQQRELMIDMHKWNGSDQLHTAVESHSNTRIDPL